MGSQYPVYFHGEVKDEYPQNYAITGFEMNGGIALQRNISNASSNSNSQLSSSSDNNCLSPIDDMTYPSEYESNPLPPQPYESFYYPQQTENIRHTPSSLGWPRGTELVKLYKFIVPKSKSPYFQLQERFTPTYETPQRVYLDESTPGSYKKNQFPCKWPGICNGKVSVFGRPADLERHYKNVHADEKDSFRCDYHKCPRAQEENSFTRKDHFRDHIRDYHKEDIGCAKGEKSSREKDKLKWQKAQRTWLAERNINRNWWRCARCLVKNYVAKQGWDCSSCKSSCEEDRVRARQKLTEERNDATMADDTQYTGTYCSNCHGSSYVYDNDGYGPFPCPVCQTPAITYSYPNIVYQPLNE